MAVIEFDSAIDPEYIGTEFGDTSYHTVVTVFEPDVVRDGMDFDYAEELLSNPDNIELKIERRQPTGSATGEKHPNTSSELPSNIRISQTEKKSTPSAEKVSSKIRESRKSSKENIVDDIDSNIKVGYNKEQLDDKEKAALLAYKSGGSYALNAKLREDATLTDYEQEVVDGLDAALEKLPTFQGKVYRTISFDGFGDAAARDAFLENYKINLVSHNAYTSTSTKADGYPIDGKYLVRFEIHSIFGRNMEGFGNNIESEVLFSRNTYFIVEQIEYDINETPTIHLKEVNKNVEKRIYEERVEGNVQRNNTGKPGSRTYTSKENQVQRLPEHETKISNLQPLSERNSDRNSEEQGDLRGVQSKIKHARKIVSISYVDKHALTREADRKITRTKGQQAKFIANYHGEKVFDRVNVQAAIDKIEALNIFTKKQRSKKPNTN